MFKCSQLQYATDLVQPRLPLSPLHFLLLLLFLLNLPVIIPNVLPIMTRMNVGEVGSQVNVQFFKVLQSNGPLVRLQHPHAIPVNKRNDPFHQSLLQHFGVDRVLSTPAVGILTVHHCQEIQL